MQLAPVTLTITVNSLLQVPANQSFTITPGQPVSFQLQASGGVAPYTWAITSGTLPTGLSMSSSGLISGTPPTNVSTSQTVVNLTVSDASN